MNNIQFIQLAKNRVRQILCFGFLLVLCNSVAADTNKVRISTDIAPVHSLVSMIVGDRATVDLIVPANQSPHDFALKPSQLRALNKAALIVIVSEDFSPSLSRHLKTLSPDNQIVNLSSSIPETDSKHEHDDEHTWLNPQNAIIWLEQIAQAVASIDEPNRAEYELNAAKAIATLDNKFQVFTEQLANVRTAKYIVHHDAYQHFAKAFGLAKPQAIALSDARAPSAAKLKQIRTAGKNSHCIFSEVQHNDAIVDTVSAGLGLKRGILDPLGSNIPIGPNLYGKLMQTLVESFSTCLQ